MKSASKQVSADDLEIKRKEIYVACRIACGLDKNQWGRLLTAGHATRDQLTSREWIKYSIRVTPKEDMSIPNPGNKYKSRSVTSGDMVCSQLLKFLYELGYDVGNIEFDEIGVIQNIPLR